MRHFSKRKSFKLFLVNYVDTLCVYNKQGRVLNALEVEQHISYWI